MLTGTVLGAGFAVQGGCGPPVACDSRLRFVGFPEYAVARCIVTSFLVAQRSIDATRDLDLSSFLLRCSHISSSRPISDSGQLKGGVRALDMPVDNLLSNWAYMVMASLAWTLKSWFALWLPECGRWRKKYKPEKEKVLRMEFQTFRNAFMNIPTQVIRTGRRLVYRVLAWNQWLDVFLRGVEAIGRQVNWPLRC